MANGNIVIAFPTAVGMNRDGPLPGRRGKRVPHSRGDEPDDAGLRAGRVFAFPTAVGMNRSCVFPLILGLCVPHSRGDEPAGDTPPTAAWVRSPQPWG